MTGRRIRVSGVPCWRMRPSCMMGDGVGHGAGFFGGVGDEDGGDVLTADAFGSQGAQVVAQVGVEAGEGFVQEQQRRARDEGACEGEALLFAAGEGLDAFVLQVGEVETARAGFGRVGCPPVWAADTRRVWGIVR